MLRTGLIPDFEQWKCRSFPCIKWQSCFLFQNSALKLLYLKLHTTHLRQLFGIKKIPNELYLWSKWPLFNQNDPYFWTKWPLWKIGFLFKFQIDWYLSYGCDSTREIVMNEKPLKNWFSRFKNLISTFQFLSSRKLTKHYT